MRDPAATRTKLHDAALRLFVDQGIAETSIRDLADAAGVAEGTLYRHYASKDALVADLFTSNYAAYAERIDALQRRHAGLRSKLQAMITDICGLFDTD
ncbi:MAG TPA: helix-turn-helix domain-containing protein, partial [Candidatus Sulfotelmatobacter sp.]|nr:helix-turn-helix domain-containing protein [Candidatus Sulfotelmatobacter sp.]